MSEDDLIEALFFAHDKIKEQVAWIHSIVEDLGVVHETPETSIDWESWLHKVEAAVPNDFASPLFDAKDKAELSQTKKDLKESVLDKFVQNIEAGEIGKSELEYLYELVLKKSLPDIMVAKNHRIDGRAFDEIRPISSKVSILPCTHGSAVFTRGETQALVSVTLGTASDTQKVEPLIGEMTEKTLMLHYNFPPFSTGEVKMIRGVSRREIGHGYLAESSFYNVMPDKEEFPYTVRIISDILESNGSSSMATVCGATLALMDAGVPIDAPVGGIAMGLVKDSAGNYTVLSDILGSEDALGLMDFKITGTEQGIFAVQMDIKEKAGLSREILHKALEQARVGRLHILGKMSETLARPRSEISQRAPRITSTKVPVDKIGVIIGPGGKTVKEIIAKTGVEIDINDDGTVNVFSKSSKDAQTAIDWIQILAGEIEIGSFFDGVVKRHAEFGMFVDIIPGKGGLVHVSSIDREKQHTLEKDYPIDSPLRVKVVGYDRETGRIRLVAPEIERQRN